MTGCLRDTVGCADMKATLRVPVWPAPDQYSMTKCGTRSCAATSRVGDTRIPISNTKVSPRTIEPASASKPFVCEQHTSLRLRTNGQTRRCLPTNTALADARQQSKAKFLHVSVKLCLESGRTKAALPRAETKKCHVQREAIETFTHRVRFADISKHKYQRWVIIG